jgi:hypothetical protein
MATSTIRTRTQSQPTLRTTQGSVALAVSPRRTRQPAARPPGRVLVGTGVATAVLEWLKARLPANHRFTAADWIRLTQ